MGAILFSKSRKSQHKVRPTAEPIPACHARQNSVSSTSAVSRTSSEHSNTSICSYDPLSLHPPMALNSKPSSIDDEDHELGYQANKPEATSRMSQRDTAEQLLRGLSIDPTERSKDWTTKQIRRRQYVYDQESQWPLKDWQSFPPGLAYSDTSSVDEPADIPTPTPRPAPLQRSSTLRPTTRGQNQFQDLIMRGDWKRRGIVFGLDDDQEVEQEKHFDLPEQQVASYSRWSLTP